MQTHVVEWEAAPTVSPLLTLLRAQLTALTFPSPYLTEAERLRANHHIHECEDTARLRRWLRTITTELARRETACYEVNEPCSAEGNQPYTLNTPPLPHRPKATCSVQAAQPHALNTRLSPTLHA